MEKSKKHLYEVAKNLTLQDADDGLWLIFIAPDNKSAMINLGNHGPITRHAIYGWFDDFKDNYEGV